MAKGIKARGLPVSKERVRKLMQVKRHPRQTQAPLQVDDQLRASFAGCRKRPQLPIPDNLTRLGMDGRHYLHSNRRRLVMARFNRKPKPGLIHHSDRSSRYCSHDYQELIEDMRAISSMCRKGNCWDNARWKAGSTV